MLITRPIQKKPQKTNKPQSKHTPPNLKRGRTLRIIAPLSIPFREVDHVRYGTGLSIGIGMFRGSTRHWKKKGWSTRPAAIRPWSDRLAGNRDGKTVRCTIACVAYTER